MESFNNSSENMRPINKIDYVHLELRVMLFHLLVNTFCFILILLLPMILASIIGTLTLSVYFFLGVYIRRNCGRKPSIFTIPVFYTLVGIAVLALAIIINIIGGLEIGYPFAFFISVTLMPLYLLLNGFEEYSYYLFNMSIIPIFLLPAILIQLGYVFYGSVSNCFFKVINVLNIIFAKWKNTLLTTALLLLIFFPVSTIGFSYKVETCSFGIDIYEYTVHPNRNFETVSRSFSNEIEEKVDGKLAYFDYLLLSSSKMLEVPMKIMFDYRGYNPHVLSESYTYEEIYWAWRKF
ncbi:MAG TPA: hypothetical protein VEB00_08205 [Clostridia bacterium]|nr:hypothetical protein [Clostridia bacterium]